MATAANFLRRRIFVLAFDTDEKKQWHCSEYRPSSMTRGRKFFETGQQVPLQLQECLQRIYQAKLDDPQTGPLVLRFWGRHYSAFVHSAAFQIPVATVNTPYEEKREGPLARDADVDMNSEPREVASSDQAQRNNDDPWDPTAWDGDLDELKRRLSGLSIPHDLKCEIHVILQQAEPTRLDELLAFLVNTASQLTYAERQALVRLDLTKENDPEIRQLLQKYQISKVVLQQWKSTVQSAHTRVVQRDMISEGAAEEETASLYEPSSGSSQDSSQPTVTPRRTKQPPPKAPTKRAQTLTPMECEAVRQGVKAKRDHTNQQLQEAPKQADQAMVPTLPTKPVREAWPEQWQQMQSI